MKISVLIALTLLLAAHPDSTCADIIRLGVLPSITASRLESEYSTFVSVLQDYFQQPVVLRSRSSYLAYREALINEDFDIALVQPFDYVSLRERGNHYLPVVRSQQPLYALVLVNDESIRTASDLTGRIIGFPPESAAVSILGIQALRTAGLNTGDYQSRYFQEHDSCMQAMLAKTTQACVTVSEVRFVSDKYHADNIRIVLRSQTIPNVTLIIHSKWRAQRDKLAEFLIAAGQSDIFAQHNNSKFFNFVEAVDSDFDTVEEMQNQ